MTMSFGHYPLSDAIPGYSHTKDISPRMGNRVCICSTLITVRPLKSVGSKGLQASHNTASKTQTHGQSFKKLKKALKTGIG